MTASPEEIRRLNEEFNEVVARRAEDLEAAEAAARIALLRLPEGRAILQHRDDAVARAQAAAEKARRHADAARETREAEARRVRAAEEDRAYTAFLSNDLEAARDRAQRQADRDYADRLSGIGRRVPPVSGPTLDAERRGAAAARDEAYRVAAEAYELALAAAREALALAQRTAYLKYTDASEAAAIEHQQDLQAADRLLEEALASADAEFADAVGAIPAALAIHETYTRNRDEIERRCEREKEDIYRQLRG
jgi:hypothetical protein